MTEFTSAYTPPLQIDLGQVGVVICEPQAVATGGIGGVPSALTLTSQLELAAPPRQSFTAGAVNDLIGGGTGEQTPVQYWG